MACWRVEVLGEVADLEFLAAILSAPELRVVRDDGRFFLEASVFDELDSTVEISTEARAMVPLLNGAARLQRRNHHDVEAGGAIQELPQDGSVQHQHRVLQAVSAELRMMPGIHAVMGGDGPPPAPEPGSLPADLMLQAATADETARAALRLWGEGPRIWPRLSNIIELIGGRANIVAMGWASRNELSRFQRTAEHPKTAGDDARHARASWDPPPNPMTLPEAEDLVRCVLNEWLLSLRREG
jgi:hypothetical protein